MVRMPIATARWASSAALIGAFSRRSRASRMSRSGSRTTSSPDIGGQYLADHRKVLLGHATLVLFLEAGPEVVQRYEVGFLEAVRDPRDGEELPGELDRVGLGLAAVLLAVGNEDAFDEVGIEQLAKRGQLVNANADPHSLSDEGLDLGLTQSDGADLSPFPALA